MRLTVKYVAHFSFVLIHLMMLSYEISVPSLHKFLFVQADHVSFRHFNYCTFKQV
jgi:hypothetical protein